LYVIEIKVNENSTTYLGLPRVCLFLFPILMTPSHLYAQTGMVDLDLLESLLFDRINEYRIQNGVDILLRNDTITLISKIECDYLCENGLVTNPNTDKTIERFFGDEFYSSYNSNIVTNWSLSSITNWSDVESRMVDGYMIRYTMDRTENTILISKKYVDPEYRGYLGLTCKVCKGTLYVSQVIYITK